MRRAAVDLYEPLRKAMRKRTENTGKRTVARRPKKPVTPQKSNVPAITATSRKVGECLDMAVVWWRGR